MSEFFVGYLPKAPAGIARLARRIVIGLLLMAVVVAVAVVIGQRRFAKSVFEFGNVREFEGLLQTKPFPVLLVMKAGQPGTLPVLMRHTLVAPGKHGADALVAAFDRQQVKLRGTLIYRDELKMIEMEPDSIQPQPGGDLPTSSLENLGRHTLTGEIVDSKCYLGVMNPGHTKPHRECAVRCISGGIPPLFIVRDAEEKQVNLWLVGANDEPINQQVLDFVAEPIEITGEVFRDADHLIFRAAPASNTATGQKQSFLWHRR